jgi:predicted phosphodiesterase
VEDVVRRIACMSDIHGNVPALQAVLEDVARSGITEPYCLGDLVGYGPDPAGVIAVIRRAGIPTVRGNYDDGIGLRRGECGCYYATETARVDGEASYAFTAAALDEGDTAWLAGLPATLRIDAEGLRVLLTHGSPRRINEYLHTDRTDELLLRLAQDAGADLVCVGHTHEPYHRRIQGSGGVIDYVNAGSVGKPKDGDPRACWTEIVLDDRSVDVRFHRVAYDIGSVQAAMRDAGLPDTLVSALASA